MSSSPPFLTHSATDAWRPRAPSAIITITLPGASYHTNQHLSLSLPLTTHTHTQQTNQPKQTNRRTQHAHAGALVAGCIRDGIQPHVHRVWDALARTGWDRPGAAAVSRRVHDVGVCMHAPHDVAAAALSVTLPQLRCPVGGTPRKVHAALGPRPERQAATPLQRAPQVAPRDTHGLRDVVPQRQLRGNARRQRAPRPMAVQRSVRVCAWGVWGKGEGESPSVGP